MIPKLALFEAKLKCRCLDATFYQEQSNFKLYLNYTFTVF